MKKFDYFLRDPQNETVSNLFGDVFVQILQHYWSVGEKILPS